MSSDNGYAAPEAIVAQRYRDVSTSQGKFQIRKLGMDKIIVLQRSITDIASMAVAVDKGQPPKDLTKEMAALGRILIAGVAQPELFESPDDGPTPSDLSVTDAFVLFKEIMDLSGASRAEGERVRP